MQISDEPFIYDIEDIEAYQNALAKSNMNFVNEIRLKYFAKALAKELQDRNLCRLLKGEIGKKFDGDFDLLWKKVRNNRIGKRGKLRNLIMNRLGGRDGLIKMSEVEEIPLLQISCPVNFDKWDGESPILVAYTPLTIDDSEWKEVYAYDADGNEYTLDAKTPPDFPVIVVGINERTDKEGNILNSTIIKPLNKKNTSIEYKDEILVYMRFLRDYGCIEPWVRGDPEVRLSISGIGIDFSVNNDLEYHVFDGTFNTYWKWNGVHYDKRWKHPNIGIYTRDPIIYDKGAVLFWFESDGNSKPIPWSISVNIFGIVLTVSTELITSGDDKIGARFISSSLPPSYYGDKSSPCYFGDLFCNVLTY